MSRKRMLLGGTVVALAVGWIGSAPPAYLAVGGPIAFSEEAVNAAAAVDHSEQFSQALEVLPADLPGHDDVVFLDGGRRLLVSAMDGRIWEYDSASKRALPFVDPPLMAAGLHESPMASDDVYFCASHLWGDSYPAGEKVGLYRLRLSTRQVEPVVLEVPDTAIAGPKVWALADARAPHSSATGSAMKTRPLAFCNDLEISQDGQRIYFSEPFSSPGASMGGGTVAEVIAYHGNGRVWLHDLSTGQTRLVAEGFFFPDGLLYDLHPGQSAEQSILVSQTAGFRIIRFFVAGPRAGTAERVQDGLPGMCDGMDRDAQGRIWCGMYAPRTAALTWIHRHPWLKHLLLRLPLNSIPQPATTGVMALSPDASRILYSAWYAGPKAAHLASAIPGPDGDIYLTPFSKTHRGLLRLPNPLH